MSVKEITYIYKAYNMHRYDVYSVYSVIYAYSSRECLKIENLGRNMHHIYRIFCDDNHWIYKQLIKKV